MGSPPLTRASGQAARSARHMRLDLSNQTDDVARARHEVGSFGIAAGLDHLEIGAVELAVGEACSNVVRHAYGEAAGAMTVEASVDEERLLISVTDEGVGIRRSIPEHGTGLGTGIMLALCDTLQVGAGVDGVGTCVTMSFAI